MRSMNVGTLCSRHPVSVLASAPLSEVARLMRDEHVGAVVVVRGEPARPQVCGIITDRDIVHAQLRRTADLSSLSAEEAMTRDPLVLGEDETVDGAIAHLRARAVRRAPVIGADGALTGLISTDDLLVHLAGKLIGSAGIVAQQIRRRMT
jgi:CBS domain-containing protein